MVITNELLDAMTRQAAEASRLRVNFDLRNSTEDQSQRMLNALEPGTIVPVHRHIGTSEVVCVLRGAVRQNFYDGFGNLVESFVIKAASTCPIFVVPAGQWHNSEALENGTIIFESKDGAYVPLGPKDIIKDYSFA